MEGDGRFSKPWLRTLLGKDYVDTVEAVYFQETAKVNQTLNPKCLTAIRNLPDLVELQFHGFIGDEELKSIAKCTQLETLRLDCFKVTDEGIRHLAALKKLKKLVLYTPSVSGDVLVDTLKVLPKLEFVSLTAMPISAKKVPKSSRHYRIAAFRTAGSRTAAREAGRCPKLGGKNRRAGISLFPATLAAPFFCGLLLSCY